MTTDDVQCVTVQTTTGSRQEAQHLAEAAVEAGAGACVQVSEIQSYYRWQGEVHNDPEFLLTIKTTAAAVPRLRRLIESEHSYDEPELIVSPIIDGAPGYLQWVRDSTSSSSGS